MVLAAVLLSGKFTNLLKKFFLFSMKRRWICKMSSGLMKENWRRVVANKIDLVVRMLGRRLVVLMPKRVKGRVEEEEDDDDDWLDVECKRFQLAIGDMNLPFDPYFEVVDFFVFGVGVVVLVAAVVEVVCVVELVLVGLLLVVLVSRTVEVVCIGELGLFEL